MKDLHRGFASASWPLPADSARAERELDDWSETTAEIDDRSRKAFARRLATTKAGKRLLAAIFGNSPFLAHCLTRDPGFAVDLLRDGPDAAFTQTMRDIGAHFGGPTDTPALMTGLRVAKRRVALAIALADIAGLWPLERVTGALSDFAEAALNLAVRRLLREAAANKALRLPASAQPERHSGFTIIAMGKLGARELNYSSDIDLIALYDSEKIVGDDPDNLQQTFVRLTRGLAKILDERTLDGYVFRTDFRLRPDPASTPLALSMIAAETYYESLGQNWERAAMIKARPIAGDIAAGAAFLDRLRPYVWRKHLDFAAIQDIHSIKRQINAHRGGGTVALAGHNIKIGRGGIREIEFFAQTQQLIWGGRNPTLRAANTCGALAALAEAGRITPDIAQVLTRAYGFLRRVEHRLQMIDDKQTQTLPADAVEMEAFAVFLGFKGAADFGEALLGELRAVEKCYADLFEESPALSGPGNLVFTGTEDDPATLETLAGIGYGEGPTIAGAVRGWHHGRYRATRSVRAREILTELMPALLQAFAKTPEPDAAFIRFDRFLSRLPAGVQLFSLFHSNPGLLDVVAEIMGLAPRLAEVLSARPQMLDAVLAPDFFGPLPGRTALDADLAQLLSQARDFEDVIEIVRRWKNERELQIGVHLLRGRTGIEAAGAHLADVAESAIAALLPAVETEFGRQHGQVPGAAFAVVALGKLGGREMTVTSDLDLIFLYDVPAGSDASDGEKPLPPSHYFIRLSNRLITALTALTQEGRLYDVDMRLRPSGSKGPIASDLAGFVTYNATNAWTWEHMALTRARPIAGPPAFAARIVDAIRDILVRPREPDKLAAEVSAMRALIAREHRAKDPWDIKHWRGGLVDVEFIAQYLQLRHAAESPSVLAPNSRAAIQRTMTAGALDDATGRLLLQALHLWQTVQGMLRLSVEGNFDAAAAPPGLRVALAAAADATDFETLHRMMLETAERVRAIFERMLPPAGEKPQTK